MGFYLLAEYERKNNFFVKEIDYLKKGHKKYLMKN